MILALSGCGNQDSSLTSSKVVTSSAMPTSSPIPTKPKEITLMEIVEKFKTAGIPVGKINEYTADNDPNKLLGRPNQYIAKINWVDARFESAQDSCTLELFKTPEDLKTRKAYGESLGKSSPMFSQYMYEFNMVLLRLPKDLSPKQAEEYKTILEGI